MTADARDKTIRHQKLVESVSQALINRDLNDAVTQVAQELARELHAECVCIFFRRKVDKELRREALAINERGDVRSRHEDQPFEWDRSYPRNSLTLLYKTYQRPPRGINYGPKELKGTDVDETIVGRFRACLPSKRFEHLIITPLYIGDKQLGGIRVVNHLDPANDLDISERGFSAIQDAGVVSSVAAMLALAYSNHRRKEKLLALREFAQEIRASTTEDDAIAACLKNLASEQTGFPLAIWRRYETAGTSRVIRHHPHTIPLDPPELPLGPDPRVKTGRAQAPFILDASTFHYRAWAKANRLGAAYVHPTAFENRRFELVVFGDSRAEFDSLSRAFIDLNVDILENILRSLSVRQRIVGQSAAIKDLTEECKILGPSDLSVLILGETGTGKGVLAEAIHNFSGRKNMPFVAFNCGALSQTLLESELFGHLKGAFTSAVANKLGLFDAARGGTLFLDEVGDMPSEVQVKLLRVLDTKLFRRVGGTEELKADVRLIAATHQVLSDTKGTCQFRQDLYFRLHQDILNIPPLRERREDIRPLAEYFLHCCTETNRRRQTVLEIDAAALQRLKDYKWPGNARELRNAIERAVVHANERRLTLADLPREIIGKRLMTQMQFKEEHYRRAFAISSTLKEAKELLRVSKTTVSVYAREHGLTPGRRRGSPAANCELEPLKNAMDAYIAEVERTVGSPTAAAEILDISENKVTQALNRFETAHEEE